MKVYAIYLDENGYDGDTIYAKNKGLIKGEKYEIEHIEIGGWVSYISIKNYEGLFNSVMFDFVNKNGDVVDVYNYQHLD